MVRQLNSSLPLLALLGLVGCSTGSSTDDQGPNDVAQIVYAVRQHTVLDASGTPTQIDVAGGMGQVMDYGRYVPGGRLEVLDLRSGDVVNLIADYPEADVSSVDVSYDATKVLFTMKKNAGDSYHVYWASLAGDREIHQLTFGAPDDINAVYANGDRIVFVTNEAYTPMGTRSDEYNHSNRVTQLGTITASGGDSDRKLCSQNLSHIVTLFSMSDGRVGFSRWEHLENVNDVKMFAMNPDCTQMVALGGQHGKPSNSLVQVVEGTTPNVFYGIATQRENTIQAGSIFKYDARAANNPNLIDEEKDDAFEVLTPLVPTSDEQSPVGRYRAPSVLPNGNLLVSWAPGYVNETNEFNLTPPDYGIYVYQSRENQLVKNYENTWEVYARPIVARNEPNIVPARQDTIDSTVATTLGSVDVRQTSLFSRHGERVDGAQFDNVTMNEALADAVKVRIIEGFSSEAAPGVTMFGLTMAEGAAMIGEAKVEADGSWLADVPPYVPIHLQPVDRFDLAIRNQTTWIQGMPGESRVCGGCHEDRTQPVTPDMQQVAIAVGRGAERFNTPIAERVEYPWFKPTVATNPNEIQQILDRRCVSCHNAETNGDVAQQYYTVTMADALTGEVETTYEIPRLDLSSTEITVTYDNDQQTLPVSYVSLFYPAALAMEMGRGAMIEGEVPPRWAVPSDARGSRLIEKLNVQSANDPAEYAWALGTAFEYGADEPVVAGGAHADHAAVAGLTRDELVKLIRAIDMGGQYYSRQNTDFTPYASDPVAGGTEY